MRKIKSIEFGLATRYLLFTIMLCALCINVKAQKLGFIGGPSMSYGIVSTSDKAASFTMIRRFPNNILSGMFGFDVVTYFHADVEAAKAPQVSF